MHTYYNMLFDRSYSEEYCVYHNMCTLCVHNIIINCTTILIVYFNIGLNAWFMME